LAFSSIVVTKLLGNLGNHFSYFKGIYQGYPGITDISMGLNILFLVVEPDYLPDSEVFVFSHVYTP
jgi:hypothetical protein